jgi:hypothetical protein
LDKAAKQTWLEAVVERLELYAEKFDDACEIGQ